MTDTVVLKFTLGNYKVNNPKRFTPFFNRIDPGDYAERANFRMEHRGNRKYTLNPYKIYRDEGVVYPNFTIIERTDKRTGFYSCNLYVSVSLPKLLWGHSFQETTDDNFEEIIFLLMKRMLEFEIVVSDKAIRTSIVQTLHYCCNIMFPLMEEA